LRIALSAVFRDTASTKEKKIRENLISRIGKEKKNINFLYFYS